MMIAKNMRTMLLMVEATRRYDDVDDVNSYGDGDGDGDDVLEVVVVIIMMMMTMMPKEAREG